MNPWPRPLQQPHPPIWIPGAGSLETIDFVARRRFAYMGIPYFHIDVFRRIFDQFRDRLRQGRSYTAAPEQMGWGVPIYVAETDASGSRRVRASLLVFRPQPHEEYRPDASRLHVGALAARNPQEPRTVLARAKDLG